MKTFHALIASACFTPTVLSAQSTAFTYQGQLQHGGSPAYGLYEMYFALYDAVTNGNPVGLPFTAAPVAVSNGLFTTQLDFGPAFMGAKRWLEISMTVFGSDQPVVTLVPRQPLTPTPYALHSVNAANLMNSADAPLDIKIHGQRALRLEPAVNGNNSSFNLIAGNSGNFADDGVVGAVVLGGGNADFPFNSVSADFSSVSGGSGHRIEQGADHSSIGGGYVNSIGIDAALSTIGGGEGNSIRMDSISATIGGGKRNLIQANANQATIGGGEANTVGPNAQHGTVAGGYGNRSSGTFATVGGGGDNVASGFGAVVAGGGGIQFSDGNEPRGNTASGDWSAIGGGADNVASGLFSVVGGGEFNRASGTNAMVPGGLDCEAAGLLSFAAGWGAKALHKGAFVWADYSPTLGGPPFTSTSDDQFSVRAAGGVRFFTDSAASTGAVLAPGSGTWSSLSDRHAKENFAAANAQEVLEKVVALPLSSWNYKAQSSSVRHLGPMAQDFHAAFGLGESDRTITTVDADGVALAAIQGLNQKLKARLQEQETEIAELKSMMVELKAEFRKLARTQELALRAQQAEGMPTPCGVALWRSVAEIKR